MAEVKTQGDLIFLELSEDGTTFIKFGCATSNGFERTSTTSDSSCKEDGVYNDPEVIKIGATLTMEGLLLIDDTTFVWNNHQLDDWMQARAILDFKYGKDGTGEINYTGKCQISDLADTAPNEETASWTCTLNVKKGWTKTPNP